MKLLENVYYRPYTQTFETIEKRIITKEEIEEGILMPLTIDEKVQILYDKAMNGTAKEYRQIEDFIGLYSVSYFKFRAMVDFLDKGSTDKPFLHWENEIKQIIQKALENSI